MLGIVQKVIISLVLSLGYRLVLLCRQMEIDVPLDTPPKHI